jgi:hypothetical protein
LTLALPLQPFAYNTANLETKECIRDLTSDHLRHFFRELHPVLLVNDATISADNDDSIEYIQCIQHTLNRTTNLVMDNLPAEMLHHFPHGTPASYLSLLSDHQPGSLGHECALAILYALKTLHLIHCLTFPATQDAPYKYMPHNLSDIIRNVPSFTTTLSLFPNRSNFRDVPVFIHTFFQDQQVATNPFDRRQDSQRSSYNDQPTYLGSSSLIAFTHSPLVNGFGNPPTGISPRSSHVARHLISAALQHHENLSTKVTNGDDPDLQPSNIILGHLLPADMLLNHHCSAFPMATLPTIEQLNNAPQLRNPATTLAVNFVTCQDLSTNHLEQIDIPDGNSQYSSFKSHFIPIPTNTYNYSIDVLPDHEYQRYCVTKTIDVIDPQRVLPQTPEPTNVLIYHCTHSENPSYTTGSSTEMPIPKEEAHTFPIICDSGNLPIIFNNQNGLVEAYTSTTVQHLFKTQACIPMTAYYEANPWACPNNHSQLWRQSYPVQHVVDDPYTILLDLATRLIQVITTRRGSDSVYRAWALPYLDNALQKPTNQTTHNRFSFFWQQHNHPEYPFTNKTPDILLDINPGESSPECPPNEMRTQSITCNSLTPPCHSHNDVNAAIEDNCNVIRHDLDKPNFPAKHNASLAVLTRRLSLLPENNPEIAPATPNPGNTDIPSDNDETQLETTETTENSPISATSALFIDTSQQNPTQRSTNPLQRFSRAVGQILTPKTPSSDTEEQSQPPATKNVPNTPTPVPNALLTEDHHARSTTRQENHTTFAYPPIHGTFFDDNDDNDDHNNDDDEPPQVPLASPDALTSSTRTDFTYQPIEDLTRTLLKYAKTANLRKLSYPTDLLSRRRQFNTFMDNLNIVCNISPWTRHVFDLWPKQISYSHPCIGTAIYNVIFTYIIDPCQKHIIDCPPDARTAILTLRRHCAPLTQDHIERTRDAFCSIK